MNTHLDLTEIMSAWLYQQADINIVINEMKVPTGGIVDVIGITVKKTTELKIAIIEVKKNRADLLSDLRAKKLLKYEKLGTHCYLALDFNILKTPISIQDTVTWLTDLGLPSSWGILIVEPDNKICVYRKATRIKKTTLKRIHSLLFHIAKSYMYKNLLKKQGVTRWKRRKVKL